MPRAATLPRQTERSYQKAIVKLARVLGWLVSHPYDSRRSTPGVPDLLMVKGSRLIYAELKSASGVVSLAQQQWLAVLAAAGAETYLWRAGTNSLQEIADLLDG